MRILSDAAVHPARIVLPVMDRLPDSPIIGELVYFNQPPRQGIYIFTGIDWTELYSTRNNIWETIIAEPEQKVFDLGEEYDCDGGSIVVYKNGVRLSLNDYAEVGRNIIAYRAVDERGEDIPILGGEKFEFQIFNVRRTKSFDVKSFNRRNGLC